MRWKTKNQYQQHVAEYKARRKKLREKYPNRYTCPVQKKAYNKAVKEINRKIYQWRLQVRLIEKREVVIKELAAHICEFMDVSLYGTALPLRNSVGNKRLDKARMLFYKYALENGVRGMYVAQWVGCDKKTPALGRMKFTRSFQYNSENKALWYQFKTFTKSIIDNREGELIRAVAA